MSASGLSVPGSGFDAGALGSGLGALSLGPCEPPSTLPPQAASKGSASNARPKLVTHLHMQRLNGSKPRALALAPQKPRLGLPAREPGWQMGVASDKSDAQPARR